MSVNTRKLIGVLVWLSAAALIGLAAWIAALTAHQDSRITLIRDRGVPVQATVTGCRAISSGVGMGIEYWDCRASYALDGQQLNAPLGGNRKLIDAGTRVSALAVPGRPDLLSTASSVRSAHRSGTGYAAAAILGAAGLMVGVARAFVVRRRR